MVATVMTFPGLVIDNLGAKTQVDEAAVLEQLNQLNAPGDDADAALPEGDAAEGEEGATEEGAGTDEEIDPVKALEAEVRKSQ